MADTNAGQYEDKSDGLKSEGAYVKQWLDALTRAEDEEKDWVKRAEAAIETFRGKKKKGRSFNILHSNVETLCPALYNSTPAPDVRRRYADADPIGKVVVDLIERALSYSVDTYDFDAVMKAVVKDGELVGRGVPRVRYVPTFGPPVAPEMPGAPEQPGEVVYEECPCDYVPWRYFRRGPARTWKDVPWVAFGDFLTREDLRQLCGDLEDKNGNLVADQVPLNYGSDQKDGGKKVATDEQSIFRRGFVWQIWDRETRRVISICPDYSDAPLAMVDDPLQLAGFFPVPRPYQPVTATDGLVPVVPFDIYEDLVLELNDITARIAKLVKQLRPRALYAGKSATDMKSLAEADDGELVPATDIEAFIEGGGVEKAIAWFPLDPTAKALQQLIIHRDQVKQVIYEVTGIADILRGSTQASETATAQQIKAQWGSLRIQDRQAEVARVSRDLFRLKAEIIASKFSWDTLTTMTGIILPDANQKAVAQQQIAQFEQAKQMQAQQADPMTGQPMPAPQMPPEPTPDVIKAAQSPTREEVEQLLRSDALRGYRIDIESDSTIRGDLTRNQQAMGTFLDGTAKFVQAMGPIVQQSPRLMAPVMEVYAAFARQFKLGKQAEDAVDQLTDMARKITSQPQQEKPDPKLKAIEAKADADMKMTGMKVQAAEREHGMKMQMMDREDARAEHELAIEAERNALQAALPPNQPAMRQ